MSGRRSAANKRNSRRLPQTLATFIALPNGSGYRRRTNRKKRGARSWQESDGVQSQMIRVVKGEAFIECTEELFIWCMAGDVVVHVKGRAIPLREAETVVVRDVEGFRLEPMYPDQQRVPQALIVMLTPCVEFP